MTPLHQPFEPLSSARHTCALPGCAVTVTPSRKTCCDAHRKAASRMRAATITALQLAIVTCGVAVTTADAQTIVTKVGLGVTAAFLQAVGVTWDETSKAWK